MLVTMTMDLNADIHLGYLSIEPLIALTDLWVNCHIDQWAQGGIKFTFQEECLLVSFFLLTEYLNVMCLEGMQWNPRDQLYDHLMG